MEQNEKNLNKVDLVFDENGGSPILANRDVLVKELQQAHNNKEHTKTPGDLPHVDILELNEEAGANQWLRPLDFLAILESRDDKKITEYVKNLETKSEQLYHDLNKIVIEKFNITDANLINDIKNLNQKNDPKIGEYLDLVDDVIYNVEADWNDLHNQRNRIDLYNVEIESVAEHNQHAKDNGEQTNSTDHSGSDAVDFTKFNYNEIVNDNQTKVNTRTLKAELATLSADALYDYINLTTDQIEFIRGYIKDKTDLYQMLATQKVEKKQGKLNKIFSHLKGNSETVDRIIETVKNSDDFNVKELFGDGLDVIEDSQELLKKLAHLIKTDDYLTTLNNELILLNKADDVLASKLAVAYTVSFENDNKFSKRLIRRNRSLAHKAEEAIEQDNNIMLANDAASDLVNGLDDEMSEGLVYDEQFALFANRKKTSMFRKSLDEELKELMRLNRSKFSTLDAKEYMMNEYFLFLNSELGIVNDLTELANLVELKRVQLLTEIAAQEVEFLKCDDLKTKVIGTLKANFEMVKVLASEILILKAILLHRDVVAVIKAQGKKQCQELMSVIEWDKRLAWWTDVTREVVTEAYFHPVYGKDEGVQYLFNELSKDEEEFIDDEELAEGSYDSDAADMYSDNGDNAVVAHNGASVVRSPLTMKFERTNVVEKRVPITLRFLETQTVTEEKPVKIVEYVLVEQPAVSAVVAKDNVASVNKAANNDWIVDLVDTEGSSLKPNEWVSTEFKPIPGDPIYLQSVNKPGAEVTKPLADWVVEANDASGVVYPNEWVSTEFRQWSNLATHQTIQQVIIEKQSPVKIVEFVNLDDVPATEPVVAPTATNAATSAVKKPAEDFTLEASSDGTNLPNEWESTEFKHEVTPVVEPVTVIEQEPVKVVEYVTVVEKVVETQVKEVEVPKQTFVSVPVEPEHKQEPVVPTPAPAANPQPVIIKEIHFHNNPMVAPVVENDDDDDIIEGETEEERLRRLARKGMTAAGYRIAELVKETQREIDRAEKDFEKEQELKEQQKLELARQKLAEEKARREALKQKLAEEKAKKQAKLKAEREKKAEIERQKALIRKQKEQERKQALKEKEKAKREAERIKEQQRRIKERELEKQRVKLLKEKEALKRKEAIEKAKIAAKNRQTSK